jgi:hypothetical protein
LHFTGGEEAFSCDEFGELDQIRCPTLILAGINPGGIP